MQKKYFARIFWSIVLICMVFSIFVSTAYHVINNKNIEREILSDKEKESIKTAAMLEYDFELCTISARIAADQIHLVESGRLSLDSMFLAMEKVYDLGHIYITDEAMNVHKKEDSPDLPEIVFDKMRSMSEEERILSYMKDGKRHIVLASRAQKNDGKYVFVARMFEETSFFAESKASAIVFSDDNGEIYIGEVGKCAEIKTIFNESGKDKAIAEIENMNFRGRNMIYIPLEFSRLQNSRVIFAFEDSALAEHKVINLSASVAMFFVVFVLLVLLAIIPAKIIYYPIDELVAFSNFYAPNIAKEDEVSCISGVIKELDEKNKKLNTEAGEKRELLKIQFIKDLLSGVLSKTQYSEKAEEFKMTEYETPFYVGIFEISDYDSLVEAFDEKTLIQIKKQIGEFITNELMGRSVSPSVEMDKKRFAVITCGCDIARIRQNFSYILSVINSEFDIEMFSAISGECVSLFEISEGYQMCEKAFEDNFAVGFRSAVVAYDDIDVGAGFYYPVNLERDLISGVLRLKKEESLKIINNILDENLNGKTLTKEKHNAIIFAFTATINRIVEALNKTVEEIYGEENIIFLELKMCNDTGSLRAKIIQTFDKIMSYMSGDEDADLSQRFLDYIHSHYNEDISLTEISAHFKLSECYLSTMFKETTGENFKEYLSRYRIKKAKEILIKNPDIKTKELASMIGCNTVATLFRLFNKYEGMSPGQFVKENVRGEQL